MSQYRADRDAARLRIENLEARLAEQDSLLARREEELASRDEEIVRLQRQVGGIGTRGLRSVNAAWASRMVGLAGSVAVIAAGAGVVVLRSSAASTPSDPAADTRTLGAATWLLDGPDHDAQRNAPTSPIHADPVAASGVEWSAVRDPFAAPDQPAGPGLISGKIPIERQLDARVWGATSQDASRGRRR